MTSITTPHWESVTDECRRAFEFLATQKFVRDFYLAGGTALALQIGHRISTDLDWFSPTVLLDEDQRADIEGTLSGSGDFEMTRQGEGLMFARLLGADVSFIYLHVPLLDPAVELQGLFLASPLEIGLMKLVAIRDRGRRRDFVDLYCLREIASMDRLVEAMEVKYAQYPDMLATVARGLTFLENAEGEPMPRMLRRVRWADVRKYAEQGAKMIVQRERNKWR